MAETTGASPVPAQHSHQAQLNPHSLAQIFPPMSAEEFLDLKADIAKHGLRQPIVLFEGKVLDGMNRARVCAELGIEPDTREYEGTDSIAFVFSQNLHRRHLNGSQRAMIAARIATLPKWRPKKEEKSAQICALSQDEAAEKMKVGRRSVQGAKKVLKKAAPEVVEAVFEGYATVSDSSQVLDATPEEQQQAVEDIKQGKRNTLVASLKAQRGVTHVSHNSGEDDWNTLPRYH